MSYDIHLSDPITKDIIQLDTKHHMKGGNYEMGGTYDAHLNITYNYSDWFVKLFGVKGIRTIYGMTGAESIPVIDKVISSLGDDVDSDYWKSTEGNAKRSLLHLVALAKMRPDGIWDGD